MKKQNPMPSVEFLKECFEYHEDGFLTWKKRPLHHFSSSHRMNQCNSQFAGKRAGFQHHSGYWYIRMGLKDIGVHRIVYVIFFGALEMGLEVDHRDGDRSNNRYQNLRRANHNGQAHNNKKRSDNTSGYRGVHLEKASGKYSVNIQINGKQKKIGRFNNAVQAALVYDAAARKHHGEFASLNFPFEGERQC